MTLNRPRNTSSGVGRTSTGNGRSEGITPEQIAAINDLFAVHAKLGLLDQKTTIHHNLKGIQRFLEGIPGSTDKLEWYAPDGEDYDITRTDCEAKIVGCEFEDGELKDLVISKVHKPIIRRRTAEGKTRILQPALVEVTKRTENIEKEASNEPTKDD